MTRWPSGWRHAVLEELDIPVSQYALDVLSAWQRSTPIEPWTNNPLGLDAKTAARPPAAGTRYAVFPSMPLFRKEVVRLRTTAPGRRVMAALENGKTFQEAWHAIRALNTPGKATETDYPIRVLDLASRKYEENMPKRAKGKPKTTGVVNPMAAAHDSVRQQNAALHHAASHIEGATRGIHYIIERMR